MKIHFAKIKHFRRLNEVKVSFSDEVTIFVGANNSGKTSTIEALSKFLARKPFTYYDFSVNTRKIIREIGKKWEKADANLVPDLKEWLTSVPTLDIWLSVCKTDFHSIKDFIPTLNWDGKTIGFRLVFQPKDVNKLFETYRDEQAKFAADLLKKSFEEFLTENLWKYFEIQTYLLPEEESETILTDDLRLNPVVLGLRLTFFSLCLGLVFPCDLSDSQIPTQSFQRHIAFNLELYDFFIKNPLFSG